jgi:hypothetical protein
MLRVFLIAQPPWPRRAKVALELLAGGYAFCGYFERLFDVDVFDGDLSQLTDMKDRSQSNNRQIPDRDSGQSGRKNDPYHADSLEDIHLEETSL